MSTATSSTTATRTPRPSSASALTLVRAGIGGLGQAWIWFLFALIGLGVVYYVLYSVAGLEQDSGGTMAVVPDVAIWVWSIILFVWGITQTTLQTSTYAAAGASRRTQMAANWGFVIAAVVSALVFGALLIVVAQAASAASPAFPYTVLGSPWLELALAPLPMLTAFSMGVLTGLAFRNRSWWVAILVCGIPWLVTTTLNSWLTYVGWTGDFGVDLNFNAHFERGLGDLFNPEKLTGGPLVIWPVVLLVIAAIAIIAASVIAQQRLEIRKAS